MLSGAALMAVLASPAQAQSQATATSQAPDPGTQYAECMKLAARNPKAAIEIAGQWEGLGGGAAATHCRAVATDNDGDHRVAALMLEDLAKTSRTTASLKADMLRQAAQSWIKADQKERAMGVLDAAIKVDPDKTGLYEDRAILRAEEGHLWDAIDDLNAALDREPRRVSSLVLRAAAYRRLNTLDLARVDVERARTLAPKAPDVWLEAGNLEAAQGHRDAARQDWMTTIQLNPKGATASVARQNIQQMDVKVGATGK